MTQSDRTFERGYDLYGVRLTSHDPGFVEERAQAAMRTILSAHFHANRRLWNVTALCRQRLIFDDGSFATCDVCVVPTEAPVERLISVPPTICIDIISDEPMPLVQQRVDRYERLGVKNIWLLDPQYRTGWRASESGLFQVRNDQLTVSGSSVGFRLSDVFDELDESFSRKRLSVSSALHRTRTAVP